MNTTASSVLLTLFCIAVLSTGCGGQEEAASEPAAPPDPAQQPIATEGFESGEAPSDDSEDDGEDTGEGEGEAQDDGEPPVDGTADSGGGQ